MAAQFHKIYGLFFLEFSKGHTNLSELYSIFHALDVFFIIL